MENKTCSKLVIKVFRKDGSLKGKRVVEDDLLLDNWIKYLQIVSVVQPTLVNTVGDSKTFQNTRQVGDEGSGATVADYYSKICDSHKIKVGTGTTGPSRSDYQLGSPVLGTTSVSEAVTNRNIKWSASITSTASYDITEAGFLAHIWCDATVQSPDINAVYNWFLFIRETFTAISVADGETISVSFKIEWQ